MEKQTLPNSTLILVFGILSIIGCCCYGIVGLIFAIIAIVMAKRATAMYKENPELYTGYNNVKTGRILAWIGVVVSGIYLLAMIILISMYGLDGLQEMQNEWVEQYGQGAPADF